MGAPVDLTMLDALGRLGRRDVPWYRSDIREECRRVAAMWTTEPGPSNEQIDAACDAYEHVIVQLASNDSLVVEAYGPPKNQIKRAARVIDINSETGRVTQGPCYNLPLLIAIKIANVPPTNDAAHVADTIERLSGVAMPGGYKPTGRAAIKSGSVGNETVISVVSTLRWRRKRRK